MGATIWPLLNNLNSADVEKRPSRLFPEGGSTFNVQGSRLKALQP